jgi:hypothetical protein
MRFIFYFLFFIHGLVHFLAFAGEWKLPIAKSFDGRAMISLSTVGSKAVGLVWLLTSIGLMFSLYMYYQKKRWWWTLGACCLVISQSLVVLYWNDAQYGTAINIVLLIPVLLSYFQQQFDRRVDCEIKSLLSAQPNTSSPTVTLNHIQYLPPVVQKWLIRSNIIGKVKPQLVHLYQKGMMRSKPQASWMKMDAEQFITTNPPGFVWKTTINPDNFFTISGCDKLTSGHGNMLIKAMNVIPIANSQGKEIDQGTWMRYLAEIMWCPSVALSEFIRWEYVNDTSARAVLQNGKDVASGLFSFDKNGDVTGFEGKRYADFNDLFIMETWSIQVTGYQEFNGIRIANKSEVTWKLKHGDFTWLKMEVTSIEYTSNNSSHAVSSAPLIKEADKIVTEENKKHFQLEHS